MISPVIVNDLFLLCSRLEQVQGGGMRVMTQMMQEARHLVSVQRGHLVHIARHQRLVVLLCACMDISTHTHTHTHTHACLQIHTNTQRHTFVGFCFYGQVSYILCYLWDSQCVGKSTKETEFVVTF